MKKLLLAALLVSGSFFGLTGCDNGKYDATPDIDKTGIPNPLDKGDGQTKMGTISFKVDGKQVEYSGLSVHAADTTITASSHSLKIVRISGSSGDFKSGEGIQLEIGNYLGPKKYIGEDSLFIDGLLYLVNGMTYFKLENGKTTGYGPVSDAPYYMEIEIISDQNGVYTGTFNGKLYHQDFPETEEKPFIEITDGKFRIKRESWDIFDF